MRFNLSHKVHRNADQNQQACAPEVKRNIELCNEEHGKNRNSSNVHATPQSKTAQYRIYIFSGFFPRTDARNKTACFFQIFRNIFWIKDNRSIKIAEKENKSNKANIINYA